jgi:hypothetical protein
MESDIDYIIKVLQKITQKNATINVNNLIIILDNAKRLKQEDVNKALKIDEDNYNNYCDPNS